MTTIMQRIRKFQTRNKWKHYHEGYAMRCCACSDIFITWERESYPQCHECLYQEYRDDVPDEFTSEAEVNAYYKNEQIKLHREFNNV